MAPSTLNDHSNYGSLQLNPAERIMDDVPEPDLNIPPLPLLYHGFGRFYDYITCTVKEPMPAGVLKQLVDDFMSSVCKIEKEKEKRSRVQDTLLEILFPLREVPVSLQCKLRGSRAASDGHVLAAHGGPMLIIEFKRECAPAEPQMASYFLQLALQAKEDIIYGWRQPCLGIIIIGLIIYLNLNSLLKICNRSINLIPRFGHARLAGSKPSHYKHISMQRQRITRSRSTLCRIYGSSNPPGGHRPRCEVLCQFSITTHSSGEETLSKHQGAVPVFQFWQGKATWIPNK